LGVSARRLIQAAIVASIFVSSHASRKKTKDRWGQARRSGHRWKHGRGEDARAAERRILLDRCRTRCCLRAAYDAQIL